MLPGLVLCVPLGWFLGSSLLGGSLIQVDSRRVHIRRSTPLHRDDDTSSTESLLAAKKLWLQYTETKTAGLVGILPLSLRLPVRFIDNVDVARGACKNSTGELAGWELDEVDRQSCDGSIADEVC